MQTSGAKPVSLAPLVATLFGLVIAFHLGNALAGKSFIRASHLGTALEYAKGKIDLMRPVIVGFNATGTPTAQELPVWQAATGLAFKLTRSTWYGWANIVSLLFFATGIWPFFQLARGYLGERPAWWATAFFLAEPLIIVMAGEAATDGFCLVVSLWFLFFADRMIRSGGALWWIPTALMGSLAAVSKLPFFMAVGLCSVFLLALNKRREWKPWALLASAGLAAAGCFALWSRYTDSLAARALFPYYELRLSHNPALSAWFFGDLHSRLRPGPWIKGGWRFLHATLGALPMVGLLIIGIARPGNWMPKLWLLATFVTTLVFTHLVLAHWHYYLMCAPGVALLCGVALARIEPFWAAEMPRPGLRAMLAGVILVFSATDGLISMKIALDYDDFPKEMAQVIREHTSPTDKLVLFTCDPIWGGEALFRSGRQGLSVMTLNSSAESPSTVGLFDLLGDKAHLNRLRSMGYDKLVLISESPVRFAAEAVNPGSKIRRVFYPETLGAEVDAWPVVYRSEDIMIKEIPP